MAGLSSAQEILVLLTLKGGPAYVTQMNAAATSTNRLSKSLLVTAANMNMATKRTWLHNQALFTARRYAFYTTLAITALAFGVAKLGLNYLSTIQTARVALRNFFPTEKVMDDVISRLYTIAALSPLLFKDVLQAFRTMYPAFKGVGISADLTIRTIEAITDALATAGRTSPGQINRIGVQLMHLAAIGRPTGQVILALARNGILVYEALRKELGLTGDEIRNIGQRTDISTKDVMEALWRFYEGPHSPFKGAALRLANKTLEGAWQTFKDILSQAAGTGEAGVFGGLTRFLAGVNMQLAPMLQARKPITLTNIAQAIDHELTPKTHILYRTFLLFSTTLGVIIYELGWFIKILSLVLTPFDKLLDAFGLGNWATKIYAFWLGTVITLWIIGRGVAFAFILRMIFMESIVWGLIIATRIYLGLMVLYRAIMYRAALTTIMFNIAMYTNPIFLLAAATVLLVAGLTILYFKWRWFHNEVNSTIRFLWNHPLAAWFIPVIGPIIVIIKYLKQVYNWIIRIINAAKRLPHGGGFGGLGGGVLDAFNTLNPWHLRIPHAQRGGRLRRSGLTWVGENGPELLRLPAASVIQPLGLADGLAGSLAVTIYPQDIYLEGKKIATVMATAVTDKEARMHGRRGG